MPMRFRVIFSKYECAMRRVSIAVLAFLAASFAAQAQVRSVELITPRLFGHFIGDVLKVEIDVRVDDGVELEPASVPRPGPINQWLELLSSRVESRGDHGATLYRVYLSYQTFYPALDARQLDMPGVTLSFKSGDRIYQAKVPTWSFGISPLREVLPPARESGGAYMQPSVLPAFYDTRRDAYRALGLASASLLALALLAYHLAWWPFAARAHRPFAQAARVIRKDLANEDARRGYRDAIIALHRAVDQTAGHAVLPEDMPGFFVKHPAFARMQEEFTRFFASSQSLFFGDNLVAALAAFSSVDLRRFSDELAAAERSAS
jgi:mxaA protein